MKFLIIISIFILIGCTTSHEIEKDKTIINLSPIEIESGIQGTTLLKIEDGRVICYVYRNVGLSCILW